MRNGDVRRLGVAPGPRAPSTRAVPFNLTFDQWEGNSEILRARCAEKGIFHSKRTFKGKETLVIRPCSKEETEIVAHEVLLIKMVAQEIIKQSKHSG